MRRADSIKQVFPMELLLELLDCEVSHRSSRGWTETQCPVHEDEDPSASISPDGQYLVCHACGFKGDLFDILQRSPRVDVTTFPEALAWARENLSKWSIDSGRRASR